MPTLGADSEVSEAHSVSSLPPARPSWTLTLGILRRIITFTPGCLAMVFFSQQ